MMKSRSVRKAIPAMQTRKGGIEQGAVRKGGEQSTDLREVLECESANVSGRLDVDLRQGADGG